MWAICVAMGGFLLAGLIPICKRPEGRIRAVVAMGGFLLAGLILFDLLFCRKVGIDQSQWVVSCSQA